MVFQDITTFESGWNDWAFKYWMPTGRTATATIDLKAGYGASNGVRFFADGLDDDGIFFLEKVYHASEPIRFVAVSWFHGPLDPKNTIGSWPRAIYVGAVRDLAQQETQHEFEWLEGETGLIPLGDQRWNTQYYATEVAALSHVQVSVGWKINFETERESFIDNLVVLGS